MDKPHMLPIVGIVALLRHGASRRIAAVMGSPASRITSSKARLCSPRAIAINSRAKRCRIACAIMIVESDRGGATR